MIRRRGHNVITTLTAPHSFTAERLRTLRATLPPDIAALPQPRVAVLLGGPNGDFAYTQASLARLASALRSLAQLGAGLMITPSRRTPGDVIAFVREATVGLRRLFWDGEGANPYPGFLAHADAFIVPANSVNMTGEPCATGKPVYVFEPDGGSAKFTRFHEALRRHGATRTLPASSIGSNVDLRAAQFLRSYRGRDRAALGEATADARPASSSAASGRGVMT